MDFTFTYEPIYDNNRKKGNPDRILFHIEKGKMGLDRDLAVKMYNQQQDLMTKLCERYGDLTVFDLMPIVRKVPMPWFEEFRFDLMPIVRKVPMPWFEEFRDFCYKELPVLFEKAHRDRPADYVLTVLRNWLDSREKEDKAQEAKEREQRLRDIQEQAADRWERCREAILQICTRDDSRRIFTSIAFESYDPEQRQLVLQIGQKSDYEWLEQKPVIEQLLQPNLAHFFGQGTKLAYRVPKD